MRYMIKIFGPRLFFYSLALYTTKEDLTSREFFKHFIEWHFWGVSIDNNLYNYVCYSLDLNQTLVQGSVSFFYSPPFSIEF